MKVDELKVLITAQTTGLRNGVAQAKSQLKGLEKASNETSSVIKNSLGKSLLKITAVTAVVAAVTKVSKAAIQAASDLAEVQNVVDVAFGEASSEINEFAQNAISQFGITEYQAKKTASTLMAMANGMGIAKEAGKTMSVQLTGLAADMASFYNVTQDVAETALRSIFTGETESLKKFGVVMTEANLKAYALSKGITKEYQSMTQAEKVALRYNYVLNATKNAQGDYARTSGSWANQVKLLSNQWQSLLAILGQGLIQVLTPLLQMLNKLLGYLIAIGKEISRAFNFSKAEDSTSSLNVGVGETSDGLVEAEKNAKKLQNTIGGFDELNILKGKDEEVTPSVSVGDIGELDTYFDMNKAVDESTSKLDELKNKFKELRDEFKNLDGVKTLSESLGSTFKKAFENIKVSSDNIKSLFSSMFTDIKNTIDKWAKPILNSMANVFNSIWTTIIGPSIELITKEWRDFTQILGNVWDKYGANILDKIGETVNGIIGTFQLLWDNVIGPIVKPFLDALSEFWDECMVGIIESTLSAVAEVIDCALTIYNEFIKPIIDWLLNKLQPVVKSVSDFVIDILSYVLKQTGEIIQRVINVLRDLIGFLKSVFTGDWQSAWTYIKDILYNVWELMKSLIKNALNIIYETIKNVWNVIASLTETIWTMIKDFLSAIFNVIKDLVTSIWTAIKNFISSILNAIKETFVTIWESIKNKVSNICSALRDTIITLWENIKDTLLKFGETIKNGVINAFTSLKDGVVNVFNVLKNAIKTPINGIIGFINGMISGVTSGINAVVKALNKINIDIPDWVPVFGGKSFGFNLGTISAPQIPYLAKGGVIKQPTMAMMGEYAGANRNPEIVTPQSLLENIIAAQNSDLANVYIQVGRQIIGAIEKQNLSVKIGDDVISSAAARGNRNYYNRTGVSQFGV